MEDQHMKDVLYHMSSRKCKVKQDTTLHLLERLKSVMPMTPNSVEECETTGSLIHCW